MKSCNQGRLKRLEDESIFVAAKEGKFNFGLDEDAPGVKMEEIDNIAQKEEILANALEHKKVPTPKVSLHYSQLVYVPKALPKTFTQKLSERIHPRVLWAALIKKFRP